MVTKLRGQELSKPDPPASTHLPLAPGVDPEAQIFLDRDSDSTTVGCGVARAEQRGTAGPHVVGITDSRWSSQPVVVSICFGFRTRGVCVCVCVCVCV